jgi:hypothetical protein
MSSGLGRSPAKTCRLRANRGTNRTGTGGGMRAGGAVDFYIPFASQISELAYTRKQIQ